MPILPPLPRPERRRMHNIIQTTPDKQHARRVMAVLLRNERYTLEKIQELTGAARFTLGRWFNGYQDGGLDALRSLPAGRPHVLPIRNIIMLLQITSVFYAPKESVFNRR